MVSILKVSVVAETFALGRVVPVPEGARIELETLVTRGNVHSRISGCCRAISMRR